MWYDRLFLAHPSPDLTWSERRRPSRSPTVSFSIYVPWDQPNWYDLSWELAK